MRCCQNLLVRQRSTQIKVSMVGKKVGIKKLKNPDAFIDYSQKN